MKNQASDLQSKLSEYRDNQAAIFKLVTKRNQTDADIRKIEKLREKEDEMLKDVELAEAIERSAYN